MAVEMVPYGGWQKNLRLANDETELIVTLEVGPRIIHYGFKKGRNIFGEFREQRGGKGEAKWMLRGGHRLWVAPEQKPRTYELDNRAVQFREIEGGVSVVAEPGLLTRLRKAMDIRMAEDRNEVTVVHRLTNEGKTPVECSPWALTVLAPGGTAIIPLPPFELRDDRWTPNQNWSLWSYTNLADPRWNIGSRCILLKQDPKRGPTKLGLAQREGWAAYLLDRRLFVKWFERKAEGVYPDGDVNFEVYADQRILELETLGPLAELAPGESVSHEERWALYRNVPRCATQKDINARILPLIQKPSAGPAQSG
ncbi:MAG: hypothetical protein V1873_04100 [Verrucomicrobiota bacterium]